jgi:hypothetical protein
VLRKGSRRWAWAGETRRKSGASAKGNSGGLGVGGEEMVSALSVRGDAIMLGAACGFRMVSEDFRNYSGSS